MDESPRLLPIKKRFDDAISSLSTSSDSSTIHNSPDFYCLQDGFPKSSSSYAAGSSIVPAAKGSIPPAMMAFAEAKSLQRLLNHSSIRPFAQSHHPQRLRQILPAVNHLSTRSARSIHAQSTLKAQVAVAVEEDLPPSSTPPPPPPPPRSSNPAMSFPCLDAQDAKSSKLSHGSLQSGPEPSYTTGKHLSFRSDDPMLLDWGGVLPSYDIAYETWGDLNKDKTNAILLHTGLSGSSHAHSTEMNPKPGWWEKFIGPGRALDTDRYFVICTNVIGGCFGSTGPSSTDPSDGRQYATRFPIVTMQDMVRAQFRLIDGLGIEKLFASVGASMGGMQSLAAGTLFPDRVGKIVSISGCARSHPYSIAMRHTQRQVLMMDPNWNRGFYSDPGRVPPHMGMKLAREIATVTYRSGPEWENRFGRQRADPSKQPALCPDFLIETYLDHAGDKFSLEYDPNSLLYVSKAMDLFDLGAEHTLRTSQRRRENEVKLFGADSSHRADLSCSLTLPSENYKEKFQSTPMDQKVEGRDVAGPPRDLIDGLARLRSHPTLVMGVASDILFPAWQQREIAETLRAGGNQDVTHVELGEDVSLFGHDTFLLDLDHVGGNLAKFLD